MIRTNFASFSGMRIDGRPATDFERDIAIMLCARIQSRYGSTLTRSEQRVVESLLKIPGTLAAKMDCDLSEQEFKILLRIAYRYRGNMESSVVVMIALKGGVPAEHPGEATA